MITSSTPLTQPTTADSLTTIDVPSSSTLPKSLHDASPPKSSIQDDSNLKLEKSANLTKQAKKPKNQIIFNVSDTRYDVVKYVGETLFGWYLSYEQQGEWDVFWTDGTAEPEVVSKMKPYQKINHFPGMYCLARKNHLGKHLMRMRKAFPKEYKFFPETYMLPAEHKEFKANTANKGSTFIVKPEASCQGRGIFLTKNIDNILSGERCVVQKYLAKPYLLDGLKFDLRVYVLLAGCDPLRIYVYEDGLVRLATEKYTAPSGKNMNNMCMHLTNYAVNKENPNFVFNSSEDNDMVGHKRSMKALFKSLEEQGKDTKTLWVKIKKLIIKTFCSVQPLLAQSYKSCQADEPYNNMCFEILGFDIMLDHKLKPYLLEVNHTPSFTTDTPLDRNIKKNVIKDALQIMNISSEDKNAYKKKKKIELRKRILTGKTTRTSFEERKAEIEKAQKERDEWESKNQGGYEKVFPLEDPLQFGEDYDAYLKEATKWWETWTGIANRRSERKTPDLNKMPPMVFGMGSPTNRPPTRENPPQNTATVTKQRRPVHTARPSSIPVQVLTGSSKVETAAQENGAKLSASPSKEDLTPAWLEKIGTLGAIKDDKKQEQKNPGRVTPYQFRSYNNRENDLDMNDKRCQGEDDDDSQDPMIKFLRRSRCLAVKLMENNSLLEKVEKALHESREISPPRTRQSDADKIQVFKIRPGQANATKDFINANRQRNQSPTKSVNYLAGSYIPRSYANASACGRYEDISSMTQNSKIIATESTLIDKNDSSVSPQIGSVSSVHHQRREAVTRPLTQTRTIRNNLTNLSVGPKPAPMVSSSTPSNQKSQAQMFNFLSPRTLELQVNKEVIEPQRERESGFHGNRMINRTYIIKDNSKKVLVINNLFGEERSVGIHQIYSNIRKK